MQDKLRGGYQGLPRVGEALAILANAPCKGATIQVYAQSVKSTLTSLVLKVCVFRLPKIAIIYKLITKLKCPNWHICKVTQLSCCFLVFCRYFKVFLVVKIE